MEECTVSGKVSDIETGESLPFAVVKFIGINRVITADENGEFTLSGICPGDYKIEVSFVGYETQIFEKSVDDESNIELQLKNKINEFETLNVTARRALERGTEAISQTQITKSDFSSNPTRSVASVLSDVQGVTFSSAGSNVQLPVIHGLRGNRILVLNNGLKHGFQNWGPDHAPEIDLSGVDNITVVKGAAGVRYGPEAIGGAVIVESDPMFFNQPFEASLGTGYRSNGRGYFTQLENGAGFSKWSYHFGGSLTRFGDRQAPDFSLTNSGKDEKAFHGGTRFQSGPVNAKVFYSFVDQELALLRTSVAESGNLFIRSINSDEPVFIRPFSYDINEPKQENQHHLGKVEINWQYSDKASINIRAGRQFNFHKEFDVRRNADLPITDLDLITDDVQLEWKHPDWFDLDGMIGVQLFRQSNENNPGTNTTAFIPNYNVHRYSAFLVEGKEFGNNTAEVGLRVDFEENSVRGRQTNQDLFADEFSFFNFTASVGWIHRFSERSQIKTNFGTAWRSPNMAELFSFGQNGFKGTFGLLRYRFNSDNMLRTDQVTPFDKSGKSVEKGLKWISEWNFTTDNHQLVSTVYSNLIRDFIFEKPVNIIGTVRGPLPIFIIDQADSFFLGTDITWKHQYSSRLTGTFGASYLYSRNIENNEPLINQPPAKTDYSFSYTTDGGLGFFDSFKFNLSTSYTFKQFDAPRTIRPEDIVNGNVEIRSDSEIFDFKDAPSGYFLVNTSVHTSFGNFSGSLEIQNLLNTSYRDYLNEMRLFADEPGMNISLSIFYNL
ncbi:MAG: TonB-dependent receptor plug domain-containing protein [Bacteroidetes bacterium]|nr:TonB-dependent receptor plug domain-containing protein [Bacteroidota bacterium]